MCVHPHFETLHIVDHPLVQHKLSQMRRLETPMAEFRAALREISCLMGYEVTKNLPLSTCAIETPMIAMNAPCLSASPPAIVPVLRAGLGMSDGLALILPDSPIGHIGLYRDEETKRPVEYVVRLPKYEGNMFIVADPMLATGHSAAHACDIIIRHGVPAEKIILMCLIAAPEGITSFQSIHPGIKIYTASLDEKLDGRAYILPGLGDAGDRLFGTV